MSAASVYFSHPLFSLTIILRSLEFFNLNPTWICYITLPNPFPCFIYYCAALQVSIILLEFFLAAKRDSHVTPDQQ